MESNRGSVRLDPLVAGAEYLLIHGQEAIITGNLWRITKRGPRVYTKYKLKKLNYPYEPSQEYYLIYNVSKDIPREFNNVRWDISKLDEYKTGRGSALPFAVTMQELMRVKVKI